MTTIPDRNLESMVDVVLVGGPPDLPVAVRAQRMPRDAYKIKVPYYGGYEHFEMSERQTAGDSPLVLQWTTRTRVAE